MADDAPEFQLYSYNPRRAMRGVEAARIKIRWPDGSIDLLWMSKKDIASNIKQFGESQGLTDAMTAYTKNVQSERD